VGGRAISISTDDPEIATLIRPWQILDVGGPVDYCLELDPSTADGSRTRPLPGLYHGSMTLLRSRDRTRLTDAFLRILGSHSRSAGPGQVRLALMPLVRDGMALLAPPETIGAVPDRWIVAQGIEAVYTVSSLVDAAEAQLIVDPRLGSDDEPTALSFGGWWLPPSATDSARSPGFAVAEVMKLVTDVGADNAGSALRAVAMLVERLQPQIAPSTTDDIKERLADALERSTSS
jgi:hypothetical protein